MQAEAPVAPADDAAATPDASPHLMLLASLDHNIDTYHKQQKTLDDLVDITAQHEFETNKQV